MKLKQGGDTSLRNILTISIFVLGLLLGNLLNFKVEAKNSNNLITETNVCVVYQADGLWSGGIPVMEPETVSYRYSGNSIFLWLPNQDRLRVDSLSVTPISLPEDCQGLL